MMHFPPVLDFLPYFRRIFRLCGQFKKCYLFPKNFSIFIRHITVHFPLVSRNLLFPPTLKKFPPVLQKFTYFLHTLCVFRFPPNLTMMHLCITQCTYSTPLTPDICDGGRNYGCVSIDFCSRPRTI